MERLNRHYEPVTFDTLACKAHEFVTGAKGKVATASIAATTAVLSGMAFAAEETFADKIVKIIKGLFNTLSTIVNPLAALCLGFCLVLMFTTSDKQKIAESKNWAKTIVIAFVLFNCLGAIITFLSGQFKEFNFKFS